ncbi:MAG TPA: acetylornithine transaminase, partial [Gammaproteobacteria bacterium]|nr:acetylornithine transaminase [Gammaproteobacteria bacterium]
MRSQMMPTYSPPENMEVSHGEGIYLYTADGQKYIDCVSGIAVNCFGHANPELVKVLKKQAERLWHVSNMFRVPEAEKLAQTLVDHSFGDHVFFANSGGEAVEAAVKAARRYHHCKGHPERKRIVAFESCFHGRTTMTVAVTGNKAQMEGFFNGDLDCDHVPFEDMDALKAVVSKEKTAAIILEPVQGEGGVRPFTNEFIKAVRELCDETGTLLIF